jgi:nicotinamide mononucleotide adenylyltransferase
MISTKGPGPIPKQTPTLTKPTTFNFTTASRSTKSKRQPLQPINKVVPVKRAIPNAYFDNESKGFDRPVQSYEHPMKKLAALVEGWKNEEEEGVTKPVKVQEVKQESEEMKMSDLDMDAWRREEEEEERKTAEKTSAQLEVTLQGIEERIAAIKRDNEERWQAILEFRRKRLRYVPIITLTLPDDDETWDATPYEKGPQDRKLLYPLWRQPEDIIILQTKQIIVKIEEEDEYDLSQNGLPYDFHVQHRRRDYERSTTPPDYIPERSSSSKGFY